MSDFDRIISSTPVNRQSAVVAEGKGETWEAKVRDNRLHSDCPPPMKPFKKRRNNEDLSGVKIGRLTVVGYYGKNSNEMGRWVVRCHCGAYEIRLTKFIKKCREDTTLQETTMCDKCRYWQKVLNQAKSV